MSKIFVLSSKYYLENKEDVFYLNSIQDGKKIIINKSVFIYLSQLEKPKNLNLLLKENSEGSIDKSKILKGFYENMIRAGILVPNNINQSIENRNPFLVNGSILNGYEILKLIKSNNNTEIYLVRKNTTNYVFKVSCFYDSNELKKEISKERFLNEYKMLNSVNNDLIVNSYDIFEHNDCNILILEYFDGINLRDYINKNNTDDFLKIQVISKVLKAFSYLHENLILHGDIHDKNILIDENDKEIKVIDFEFSNYINNIKVKSKAGIDIFAPPERIGESIFDKFNENLKFESEVYQIGVVIYYIIFGKYPYISSTWKQLKEEKKIYIYDEDSKNEKINLLLKKSLTPNTSERFKNAKEMYKFLIK